MLQRHTDVRMQAAELREQQAGCSGAAQPQGGRFPLCVSETHIHKQTHTRTHREHKTISVLQIKCQSLDCTITLQIKSQIDTLFNPLTYKWGLASLCSLVILQSLLN